MLNKNNGWHFWKNNKIKFITHPRSLESAKQDKYHLKTHKHIILKLFKITNKEKILKAARGKRHNPREIKDNNYSLVLIWNCVKPEVTSLKCWKKQTKTKNRHLEFYAQQSISFKIKVK